MLSVGLGSLWADEEDKMIIGINEATENIKSYIEFRKENLYNDNIFVDLMLDIRQVLEMWTGNTYIGCPKTKTLENAYQSFFENLMGLILMLNDNAVSLSAKEKLLATKSLFRGVVYRYIGSGKHSNKKKVAVKYNDIFVSWSKNESNRYIESKLYGSITKIKAEIKEPYYGIDLDVFDVSKGEETEVVFPTVKECICEIKEFKNE